MCVYVRESPGFSKLLIRLTRYTADRNEGRARERRGGGDRETPCDDRK